MCELVHRGRERRLPKHHRITRGCLRRCSQLNGFGTRSFSARNILTRSLVAVKPRRPPKTNKDTETAFRHDHCKTRLHIQKVNISEVRGQLIPSNSEVRVHADAKFGHTGCWSIAKCSHPGTSQVDFQVDRPPPANSPPGDL